MIEDSVSPEESEAAKDPLPLEEEYDVIDEQDMDMMIIKAQEYFKGKPTIDVAIDIGYDKGLHASIKKFLNKSLNYNDQICMFKKFKTFFDKLDETVINEHDMNAMIIKVQEYLKVKTTMDVAVEIGFSRSSHGQIGRFVKKHLSYTCQIAVYKKFKVLFNSIDVNDVAEVSRMRKHSIKLLPGEAERIDSEMDTMIAKVELYRQGKSFKHVADDIKLSKEGVRNFVNKANTSDFQRNVFKKFEAFFSKLDAADKLLGLENPLQLKMKVIMNENKELKKKVETLDHVVELRDQQIEEINYDATESKAHRNRDPSPSEMNYEIPCPNLDPPPSAYILATPIKREPMSQTSQTSQNVNDICLKERNHELFKKKIRDIIRGHEERRR
uniref:Uncharacterized protein n=1 Tax=Panagrolaimus sp. ES5 TaxID=591445 RepID=A0AC34FAY9_9BILA